MIAIPTNPIVTTAASTTSGAPDAPVVSPANPLTPEELTIQTPPVNNLINTSTQSRTNFSQNTSDLNAALAKLNGTPTQENPNPDGGDEKKPAVDENGVSLDDPIMKGLTTLQTNSDAATKSLIASTIASYQNQRNTLTNQYENYKRGLQQLGVETGAAQSTPDLLAGHILQAGNDELTKINDIQAKESKALIDAQSAKDTNDFKTLEAKMTYVNQLKTEKADAIKNMYDTIASTNKGLAEGAHYELYNAFQTITDPKDKNTFIEAIAKQYKVSPLAVTQALQDEQDKRDKASLATQNTKSVLANRGKTAGSGSVTKAQISTGTNVLKTGVAPDGTKIGNPQGKDGFYDPSVYIAAFQDWPGSAKAFVTAYPIVGSINPKSYKSLPDALQSLLPKTKTSSGRTS